MKMLFSAKRKNIYLIENDKIILSIPCRSFKERNFILFKLNEYFKFIKGGENVERKN